MYKVSNTFRNLKKKTKSYTNYLQKKGKNYTNILRTLINRRKGNVVRKTLGIMRSFRKGKKATKKLFF